MAQSTTPMEDLTEAFKPTTLEIHNDSHLHSHHKAMQGTHFRVAITSEKFKEARMQPARHRMVYALLKDELAQEGGIHALQLKTRTPEEEERQKQKEQAE
ncbi:bola-like protein [Paraphaeosphaeria sporulosa]|uniref:Bola-like protein n=1 Tax=Paraphaeosphaeria sporulosa TaxID=1460663 RepID=A0A177CSY2_9PLEO|nr:bola-like protein [Paraphaeosphaeria sporulosa]OAG10645.1 bola-like protein [Paraphaeosphaeria sporulosa]